MYTAQKTKYDSKVKRNEKKLQNIPPLPLPKDETWDLPKVRLLVTGQFKHDDDDEEDEPVEQKIGQVPTELGQLTLGRAMLDGGPNEP